MKMKRFVFLSFLTLLLVCFQSSAQQKYVKDWIEGAWSSPSFTMLIVKNDSSYSNYKVFLPQVNDFMYFDVPNNSVSGTYLADDGLRDAGEIVASANGTLSIWEETFVKNDKILPELKMKYDSYIAALMEESENRLKETKQFCKENDWIQGEWKGDNHTYLIETMEGWQDGKFVVVTISNEGFSIKYVTASKTGSGKYKIEFPEPSEEELYVDVNYKTLSSSFDGRLAKTAKRIY